MQKPTVLGAFESTWNSRPKIVASAPGRANLIGAHVDYNGGVVLPLALPFRLTVAASLSSENSIHLVSETLGTAEITPPFQPKGDWADLARGVFWLAQELGLKTHGKYYIQSEIPLGSGLSSSAAFEVALLAAIFGLNSEEIDRRRLASLGQRVENEFLGVRSGIMDQMASALGRENNLILIDCAKIEYRYIKWPKTDCSVWIIHTGISRTLASTSEYNKRRAECERALEIINSCSQTKYKFLAHVPIDVVYELKEKLGDVLFRRARHVTTEIKRVYEAVEAIERGDLARVGSLIFESHASSRDDYEVSCPELNLLVTLGKEAGALGARLTGAGFGGASIFLVPESAEQAFSKIPGEYQKRTGRQPKFWKVWPSNGLSVEPLP